MSRRDHILRLLEIHRRSLQELEKQQALFGASTPAHISLEIEDRQAEIERLVKELALLDTAGGDAVPTGQMLQDGEQKLPQPATARATILFLAANPADTVRLRLDQEVRGIDAALRQADHRDSFELEQHWAVRAADLQGLLLRYQPEVVHFSGHGSEAGEIMLEDNTGKARPVSREGLSRLFSVLKDNIRVVVLNACYSEPQAEAIAQHVDCVIGMKDAMGDTAAASFSAAFYQALAYGRSVQTAFDLACNQVLLEGLEDENVPQLLSPHTDPAQVVLVA